MNGLEVTQVTKRFGKHTALNRVSLHVPPGEIMALLGPSGCGKSTLLYSIAGLEQPEEGDISWDGVSLRSTPPHKRGFGLMFQDFALFPHRSVADNVAFGLRMAGAPPAEISARVDEVLALVGLAGFGRRDVNTLSGGEAQRVALARALAPRPRLLMLDEPLGSLDRNLRQRLAQDLGQILRLSRQTAIYVTHDLEEAFMLADRVTVMNAGQVEQVGPPAQIYRRPANTFVARFFGLDNLLAGQAQPDRAAQPDGQAPDGATHSRVTTAAGTLRLPGSHHGPVTVLLRPDTAQLPTPGTPAPPGALLLSGQVQQVSFRGSLTRMQITSGGQVLNFEFPSHLPLPAVDEAISVYLEPEEGVLILDA